MTIAPGQEDTSDEVTEGAEIDNRGTDGAVAIQGRSPGQIVWARVKRDKVTMVAMVVSILFLLVGATAPLMAMLGILKPDEVHPDLLTGLGSLAEGFGGGMSWEHPLGVEPGTGRDVLSRIITGMTTSLIVAVLATVLALVLGVLLGIISGFAGGKTDYWISRFTDLTLSFPSTLMLISLQAVLVTLLAQLYNQASSAATPKITFMVLVLGFFGYPFFARIIRGQVLSLREREFIEAARSLGAKRGRLYFKELLPHLWAPILVYTTLVMPANISAEAALGYLGIGLNPPTASLGAILNSSVLYALPDPAFFLFPGLTVFLLVLSFNLLGDGLRDALDPKSGRA